MNSQLAIAIGIKIATAKAATKPVTNPKMNFFTIFALFLFW
jgi:hypothetical protein